MKSMVRRPPTVTIALIFSLLNALLWLGFGIIVAVNAHPALPEQPSIKWPIAVLSLGTSGTFLGLFFFLRKQRRSAYFLALVLFLVIALLILFDEFGFADLVVLMINLLPLFLLLKDRAWYLQSEPRVMGRK